MRLNLQLQMGLEFLMPEKPNKNVTGPQKRCVVIHQVIQEKWRKNELGRDNYYRWFGLFPGSYSSGSTSVATTEKEIWT